MQLDAVPLGIVGQSITVQQVPVTQEWLQQTWPEEQSVAEQHVPVAQVLPQQTWPVPQFDEEMQATQTPFEQTFPPAVVQVVPSVTAQQVPRWPLMLQAWQSSQEPIMQQTPFTQLPV